MSESSIKDTGKLFKTADEVLVPETSIIQGGSIPSWLHGSFIRVGPGKFDFEQEDQSNFTVNHWLDGYALLSKFEINPVNQTVSFTSKFLQSDAYKKALRAGRPLITEFGTKAYPDPEKNMFSRFFSSLIPEMSDNDSVSLFQLWPKPKAASTISSQKNAPPPELFVTSNTQYFHKISSCSLETGPKLDYQKCFGFNGVCVHPIHDPRSGITYNLGFSVSTGLKYHFIKILPTPTTNGGGPSTHHDINSSHDLINKYEQLCTISSRWNGSIGYFHSFGLSTNYIIFIEQPYSISLTRAAKALIRGDSFKDWLEWRPKEKCRFYLIDKESGVVNKTEFYSSEPFFFLHFVNCFEDMNNQLVIDLITFQSPAVLESMYLNKLRNTIFEQKDPACAQRFVIPLIQNISEYEQGVNLLQGHNYNCMAERTQNHIILTPEILSEYEMELPTINSNYLGKDYKYFYAVCDGNSNEINSKRQFEMNNGSAKPNSNSMEIKHDYSKNSICKVNTETRKTALWFQNEYSVPGEPIFLQNPDIETEDEGILVSSVTDLRNGANDFLIFLNAKNLEEIGRAQFKCDLPQAMHGIFLNNTC